MKLKYVTCSLFSNTHEIVLSEKRPNTELFWSLFSHIWTEYGDLRSKSYEEIYSVQLREKRFTERFIQSKCGKIRPRKTPYLDTFSAVLTV